MIINDVLYDKEYLSIQYISEQKLIYLVWKRFATSAQFREGLNFALETVKENGIELWLANLKLMEVIAPADEEWASHTWFPLLGKSTIRKMAIVTSLDYFNNTSVKRIVSTAVPVLNFETRYFIDVTDAREWLLKDH
jgi:hypothetical protein